MSTTPPTTLKAAWFDGQTARRTDVALRISGRTVEVAQAGQESDHSIAHVPLDSVQVSERVGNTPYRLTFPGGGLAVTSEHAAVESAFQLAPSQHWLARMEQASGAVAAALVGLAAALYFAWQWLIPLAADAVAQRIPRDAEKTLGTVALKGMDRWLFKTSKLESSDVAAVRAVFDELAAKARLADAVELQFRDTVPNALALPGGTVIVTDGLVHLFKADPRLLAGVIAHELGHIEHRHSLRHLLAGSASAMMVGALLGDVSGVSALVTSAPLLLTTLHYTREAEGEADRYAFDLLKKAGRSPRDFADSMRRFEAMELCLALRQKLLTGKFGRAWGGGGTEENETQADRDSREKELQSVPNCSSDPDAAIKGHESEVANLRNEDGETGYLHTHPVTQERIRAAEAAAAP